MDDEAMPTAEVSTAEVSTAIRTVDGTAPDEGGPTEPSGVVAEGVVAKGVEPEAGEPAAAEPSGAGAEGAGVASAESEAAGPPPGPVVAPPWTGQIYYLVGGVLPKTYLPWVWHDLRGPGWRRRQAARPALLTLPFAVVFALLPGQIEVRVTIVAFVLAAAVGLGVGTSGYFRNRRLVQHGFAPVKTVYADEDYDE